MHISLSDNPVRISAYMALLCINDLCYTNDDRTTLSPPFLLNLGSSSTPSPALISGALAYAGSLLRNNKIHVLTLVKDVNIKNAYKGYMR